MSDSDSPSSCPDGPVSDPSCSQLAAEEELPCSQLTSEEELCALCAENDPLVALIQQQTESAPHAKRIQLADEKELRALRNANLAYRALIQQQYDFEDNAFSVMKSRVELKEKECAELVEALEASEAERAEFLEALREMEEELTAKKTECAVLEAQAWSLRDSLSSEREGHLGLRLWTEICVREGYAREHDIRVLQRDARRRYSFECLLLLLLTVYMFTPVADSGPKWTPSGQFLRIGSAPVWRPSAHAVPMLCTDLAVVPPRRYPSRPVAPQCPMRRMPRVAGVARLGLAAVRQPQRVRTVFDAMPLVLEKRVEEVIPEAVQPEAVVPEADPPEEGGSSTALVHALRLGVTALVLYVWQLDMIAYAAGALVLRTRTIPGYHR